MTENERRRLENIIGYGISNTAGEREFILIDGVIYADLFEGTPTVEGMTVTGVRFNGKQGGTYFNEIRVDSTDWCKDETTVKVTADWGSDTFETDAQELLDYISSNATGEAGVRSKKIEDFSVTVAGGEESINDFWQYVNLNWGWMIRNSLLIDIAPERDTDDYLSF